jgi:hypothetical protein
MADVDGEILLDPAVQRDPFGYYQRLREQQPVLRMPGTGFYVLTRYEDLRWPGSTTSGSTPAGSPSATTGCCSTPSRPCPSGPRAQGGLDPGQQQLLDPHDRGDGRHVVGVLGPPDAPLAVGFGNGVERVWIGPSPTVRDTAGRNARRAFP